MNLLSAVHVPDSLSCSLGLQLCLLGNLAIIFRSSVCLSRVFLFFPSLTPVWMVQSMVIFEGEEANQI